MSKTAVLIILCVLAASLFSQEVIQNPARPLNPQAGRTLEIEKVWEVPLGLRSFIPMPPLVDSRGALYVLGAEPRPDPANKDAKTIDSVLLKFSPDGQSLGNLYKKCPDPAEFVDNHDMPIVAVSRDRVYVGHGGRIIRFDSAGNYLDEVWRSEKTPTGQPEHFGKLLGVSAKGFVVHLKSIPARKSPSGPEEGLQEEEIEVDMISLDGASREKIAGFPHRVYLEKSPGLQGQGFIGYPLTPFLTAFDPDTDTLYVSYTREYGITKVNADKRQIVARFSREYQRVKPAETSYHKDVFAKAGVPQDESAQDIHQMTVCEGNLWVVTSTESGDRRSLVDVFDPEGRYIDSFFLGDRLARFSSPAPGGYLYVLTGDVDKNWVVQKFRMLNGPKAPVVRR